jgi:DNA-binding PadR family transcriptional regulator
MSAKHALLGLLLQRPAYPYELADRLQSRLGPAWEINSGQLYQTIKGLERDGLIEPVAGTVEGREDRRVRAITDRGIEEFERWFAEGSPRARLPRRPLLVKLTLAGPDRLNDALSHLDAYEQECTERLSELSREVDAVPMDGLQVRADHVMLRLSLSADVFQLEAELGWARHARERIAWLKGRDAIWLSTDARRASASAEVRVREQAREELFGRLAARDGLSSLGDAPPKRVSARPTRAPGDR